MSFMKNLMIKFIYYFIIVPLKCILPFIIFEKYKWYRKMKGGVWKNYFPRMYPYIVLWTRGKLYSHEVECGREDWGKMIIEDSVAKAKKKRKKKLTID